VTIESRRIVGTVDSGRIAELAVGWTAGLELPHGVRAGADRGSRIGAGAGDMFPPAGAAEPGSTIRIGGSLLGTVAGIRVSSTVEILGPAVVVVGEAPVGTGVTAAANVPVAGGG
jgi:hypothetical protein